MVKPRLAGMSSPRARALLFLHIRKTGGAALTGVLSNRFAESDCLLRYSPPAPDLQGLGRYRYVAGHVPVSFVDRFESPPYVVTFLRDPIERALSTFSFLRTRPPEFPAQVLIEGGGRDAHLRLEECMSLTRECTIEGFIDRAPELAREYLGNGQTRMLCASRPEGGEEDLDHALEGLRRCDFVGLTERLGESADWLAGRLGWTDLKPMPRTNVTPGRIQRDQLSAGAMEGLMELTSLDRELHGQAVRTYERWLAEWRAAGSPRDPSAEIADAAPVTDLPFHLPIRGGGWIGREDIGGRPFCWIGETKEGWVELATDRRAECVIVEMAHVLDQGLLNGLRILVNGHTTSYRLVESGDAVVARAALEHHQLQDGGPTTRVTVKVERTVRPCDVDRTSNDDRQLSIAVRRIAFA